MLYSGLLPSTFGVMGPLLFVGAGSAQEKEITDTDSWCWLVLAGAGAAKVLNGFYHFSPSH